MEALKVGLVLDDSLDRGDGVQQYVRTLGNWLAGEGHAIHYLVGQSRGDNKTIHSLSRNVGVRFNGNRLSIPLPANARVIKSLLEKERYDVLHVQMPYSPFMAGKIIRQASTETAVVSTFHVLPFGRIQRHSNRALGLVQKRQLQRLDATCSVSPAAQRFAQSHYGLNSSVIPNMVDSSAWHSVLSPHPRRIVFLGRLVPRKGCLKLLKAISGLPEDLQKKVEVLIAGDGPERKKLERFARKQGLRNITFLGYIDNRHKADLLASAELAVFPAPGGESFGIVLIEAMAAGAGVVIGGNNPGYASVLGDWPETLVDPQNSAAFAQILERFLTDEVLRYKVHDMQQIAVKKYDVGVVGEQILDMYRTALLHRQQEMR